jgi:hypothetical protein
MNAFRYPQARLMMPPPAPMQHMFLISTPGESRAPLLHRGLPLQSMQLVLLGAESLCEMEDAVGPIPSLPPQLLLHSPRGRAGVIPKEITGEILRDADGRLYERAGDRVRPVRQLFTGARGEVIDLLPAPATPEPVVTEGAARPAELSTISQAPNNTANPPAAAGGTAPERCIRELARRLVPEPGFWRVIRYADFIDVLGPQLNAAARLQPGHQLACYVEVFEVCVPTSTAELDQAAAREFGVAGKILPLSYELCRRFGLSLPRPAFALAAGQSQQALCAVAPGARFITLRVALDPTLDTTPTVLASGAQIAASPAAALKCDIPDEFSKAWELRLSRDEAAYDQATHASHGFLRRCFDRLFHRVGSRDLKKWHSLLQSRTTEQQLWSVRPPRGAFNDSRVARWLEHTLQLGGYDVARMRIEWEIFWRRQGL